MCLFQAKYGLVKKNTDLVSVIIETIFRCRCSITIFIIIIITIIILIIIIIMI